MGGQRHGRIAGVDASFLDVLQQPSDDHVLAVRNAVDIQFDGILQKLVYQDRLVGRHVHCLANDLLEVAVPDGLPTQGHDPVSHLNSGLLRRAVWGQAPHVGVIRDRQVGGVLGDGSGGSNVRDEVDKGIRSLTQSALSRLNVVSREEFDALTNRIEKLTQRVEQMETMHRQEAYADLGWSRSLAILSVVICIKNAW